MSPVGYWPQLHAAIEAGADAVYFGLTHFTARAKVGFTLDELPDVMRTLHGRGVRGYLTFNTLIFEHEWETAAETLTAIARAGVDAIIVQDIGIARLAAALVPDLEIHGSTQMSITSAEGVALAQQFGVRRVVLARELSLKEVRAIRAATDCELEMFVHGALCVSYSGQCFSSEAWGGRSANRGQCAQACRLPYELLVDDMLRPLGDARYLLSPGDLYALHQIPEIVTIGVSALKIEGRYKDADYVALTTAAYRKAVDEAWADLPLSVTPQEELQLEQVYSRGLGAYFVSGTNHQAVVRGRTPRHRGVLAGSVVRVTPDGVTIVPTQTLAPLKPGDGIVFDAAGWRSPEEAEEGGRIYAISAGRGDQQTLAFANGAIDARRIRPGDLVWRTHDPDVARAARPYTQANEPLYRRPVDMHLRAHAGRPPALTLTLAAQPALSVTVEDDAPLGMARNQALDAQRVAEQLGRLGGTPYRLGTLTLDVAGQPFVPVSLLNQLRRMAVGQLEAAQTAPPAVTVDLAALARLTPPPAAPEPTSTPAHLHLLVRTPEQMEAALALRPDSITLDYLDLYGLRPAVQRVQAAGITARVASPRVLKPQEQRIVRFLLSLECELLVRSAGLLQALQAEARPPLHGDFSLNAANALTAETLLALGLTRLTPTHDLNAAQIADLTRRIGGARIEVVAYHHLPVFHTEHCVFCRFLSDGTDYTNCGQPCERHKLALRDVNGRAHPVLADVGCRNTVFGAEAQEAGAHLAAWRAAGARHVRLEFVHETAAQLTAVAQAFRAALDGVLTPVELQRALRQAAPQGTTEGSLYVPDSYLTLPVLQ